MRLFVGDLNMVNNNTSRYLVKMLNYYFMQKQVFAFNDSFLSFSFADNIPMMIQKRLLTLSFRTLVFNGIC
jgi:hypothetical protein